MIINIIQNKSTISVVLLFKVLSGQMCLVLAYRHLVSFFRGYCSFLKFLETIAVAKPVVTYDCFIKTDCKRVQLLRFELFSSVQLLDKLGDVYGGAVESC